MLSRKRVCITGATGGLGSALAIEFAKEGSKLFLTGRDQSELQKTKKFLESEYSAEVDISAADLATDEGLDIIIAAMSEVGGIDILINNAGILVVKSIFETARNDFDLSFATNARAPFFLSQAMIKECRSHGHGWGRIVNIGSSSAFQGFSNTSVYCGTKHALLGISRSFFVELKNTDMDVRVYSLNPGSIQTNMGKQICGQDFNTFLKPKDISVFIINMLRQDCRMIPEEVRLNRVIIK